MSRNKAYTRSMRAKHIKRKKRIICEAHPWLANMNNGNGWYPFEGQYSKGKIHCSCKLCSIKAYYGKHMPSINEMGKLAAMEAAIDEVLASIPEELEADGEE